MYYTADLVTIKWIKLYAGAIDTFDAQKTLFLQGSIKAGTLFTRTSCCFSRLSFFVNVQAQLATWLLRRHCTGQFQAGCKAGWRAACSSRSGSCGLCSRVVRTVCAYA